MTALPMKADDFATMAERRAWLDSFADERAEYTTTPTQKRLRAANDNRRIGALDTADALFAPNMDALEPDFSDPMDKDTHGRGWRMRPDIGEVKRAIASGRVAYRTASGRTHAERSASGTRHIGDLVFTTTRRTERAPVLAYGEVVTGEVPVPAGAMIARGYSDKGNVLKPGEYRTFERKSKEQKTAERLESERAVKSYVKLHGSWNGYVSWADRLIGPARPMERPPTAAVLAALGVDGSIDFDTARARAGLPTAKRLPTGNASEGHWFGGATRPSPDTNSGNSAAREGWAKTVRVLVQRFMLDSLNGDEIKALSLATSSATATEIGDELGCNRHRASRIVDAALEKQAAIQAKAAEIVERTEKLLAA